MSLRIAAALAVVIAMAVATAALIASGRQVEPRPATARPVLLVVTSLPLFFGETFTLDQTGSPTATRLAESFTVRTIAQADAASLAGQRLLLMAHPRAQTADALVALDAWVRRGGRLLLFADPVLDWHSERPLGDRLRPPPGFADTGLLRHWGVVLTRPTQRGPVDVSTEGRALRLSSPGRLTAGRGCDAAMSGHAVRCTVGRGRVTVVADADLLDPLCGGDAFVANLDAVVAELRRLDD